MSFVLLHDGLHHGDISVRLAQSQDEIKAAQRLRYQVFYEECGAEPSAQDRAVKMEISDIDDIADHLIVVDHTRPHNDQVVGNYRLFRKDQAARYGQFYSQSEYDISGLINSGEELLEMGRTCIHKLYRTKPVLNLLWKGLAVYVGHYNIRYLFGCASFMGTVTPDNIAQELSYLYHYHLAPSSIRAKALDAHYVPMNMISKEDLDKKAATIKIPTLIKSYLKAGGVVSDGAFIDTQFNAVDVFMTFDIHDMDQTYRSYYELNE